MEAALGHDFGSVRVHADDARAPRIGALAFARGEHLHFAPGAWRPESAGGRAMLGHELAHVVQQRERRVRPTRPGALPVNDDPKLEREADTVGARAVHGARSALGAGAVMRQPSTASAAAPAPATGPVQMTAWWKKALIGAGAVGAGALLLGGSPLLGAGLGLATGIGAYREYRKHQKSGAPELDRLRKLHGELGRSGDDPLLHGIVGRALGQVNSGRTTVTGGSKVNRGSTDVFEDDSGQRRYEARLDDKITDPHHRESYLLHELVHTDADQSYSFNRHGTEFTNEPYVGDSDREAGTLLTRRRGEISRDVGQARDDVSTDHGVSDTHRQYIDGRLAYIQSDPNREYDTVTSELLLYAHRHNLPRTSPTVQHIRRLAQDSYDRRSGPYATNG
ncbi:MAG TPA: DUF4157 domain-containing protein [Longimicrobium sp.]|nr:DUF4157 domain-containing protein [Longimicrobium sp.]